MKTITILNFCPPQLGIILISVLMLFSHVSFAQYGYFEQGYGGSKDEEAMDLHVANNFNVLLAGWVATDLGDKDIQLIYTDSMGDTLWTQQVGGSGNDVATSVTKTENEFLVAGFTNSSGNGGYDAYLLSIDPDDGSTNWSYTYGTSNDEKIMAMAVRGDGYIYLAGYKEISDKDVLMMKVSSSGVLISTTTYGGEGNQEGRCILDKAGYLYIAGTDYSQTNPRGLVVKVNTSCSQISYVTTNVSASHEINSITAHFETGYYLGGFTTSSGYKDALIIKMDSAGNNLDHQTIGLSGADEYIKDIFSIGDAVFAVGGSTNGNFSEGGMDLFFITTDSLLDTVSTIYAGGEYDDWGNAICHRNGLIYIAGYNSSFGVTETGNMYEIRINLYDLIDIITSHGATATPLYTISSNCKMQRAMYVESMFGRPPTEAEAIAKSYEPIFCRWCGSGDWEIAESEITNPSSGQYAGIIGNETKEDELLEFCITHNINQLVFYQSDYIFSDYAINNYTQYYTVRLANNSTESLSVYMKKKLHAFIRKAWINYKVFAVGIAAGEYRLANEANPGTFLYANMLYLNSSAYNDFAKTIQVQNYTNAGKIREMALEHEFWNFDYDSTDNITDTGSFTYAFYYHKIWLQRMLTLSKNDLNLIFVDDYIAGMVAANEGDETQSTSFLYRDQSFVWHFNSSVQGRIDSRVQEIESITDAKQFNKRVSRFFQAYYLQCRFPTNRFQKSTSYTHHCDQPNSLFVLGGRETKYIEASTYTPYIPWHVEYLNYSLTRFGNRGVENTNVYPLFGADAACIDSSTLSRDFTSQEKYTDNYLGFWLATLPQSGTEARTLKSAEAAFIDNFPNSNFYSSRGSQLAINGFCYFTYQLLKELSDYNIAQSQSNNFSSNLSATDRGLHDPNTNFSILPCSLLVASGYNNPQYKTTPTNVANTNTNSVIGFYPNPTSHVLNYAVKVDGFDKLEIAIYDLLGKEIIRTSVNGHEGAINLIDLPNGLYLVAYTMQAGSTAITGTQKLMIAR
ncbi:MAG: T9SS type A sorting domain-containing protein [Bacteroidia bacterium]|nr:T9SS type A sorting domain-containing protein [Bacteroidia bacterium]